MIKYLGVVCYYYVTLLLLILRRNGVDKNKRGMPFAFPSQIKNCVQAPRLNGNSRT